MVNTDLMPLDMEELKTAGPEKKSKDLWKAFEIAKTNPDLAYFKNILKEHDEAVQADNAAREERAAKKAKKDTKAKRKSKGAIADEDVDIEDVEDEGVDEEEGGKKAKPSRKRKKDVDSEGEQAKASALCWRSTVVWLTDCSLLKLLRPSSKLLGRRLPKRQTENLLRRPKPSQRRRKPGNRPLKLKRSL